MPFWDKRKKKSKAGSTSEAGSRSVGTQGNTLVPPTDTAFGSRSYGSQQTYSPTPGTAPGAAAQTAIAFSEVQVPTDTLHDYSAFTNFTVPARRNADWCLLKQIMHEASVAATEGARRIANAYAQAAGDDLLKRSTNWDDMTPETQTYLWKAQMDRYKESGDGATTRYVESVEAKAKYMYESWNPEEFTRPPFSKELIQEIPCLPDYEPTLDWIDRLDIDQRNEMNAFLTNPSHHVQYDSEPGGVINAQQQIDDAYTQIEHYHQMQQNFALSIAEANGYTGEPTESNPYGEGRA
ncbi:hypothetical protein I317_05550 [Kwoniella heveanensis CBS 569]|nr:hypothetical protein I317_05550 [Kwoniella heveanensis CBS 569]